MEKENDHKFMKLNFQCPVKNYYSMVINKTVLSCSYNPQTDGDFYTF